LIYKTLHWKLKMEQHEKPWVNSGGPEVCSTVTHGNKYVEIEISVYEVFLE
jgi:hypothetical protein